jgi:hypothetical protein
MTNVHVRVPGSTVCKIDAEGHRHFTWEVDEEATKARKAYGKQFCHSTNDDDVLDFIKKADLIENEYFRLRAKAVISILRVFGKRRGEISMIRLEEIEVNNFTHELEINFHLLKKRKMGLFQYRKYLKEKVAKGELSYSEAIGNKTDSQLENEWQQWRATEVGTRVKTKESLHSVDSDSPFAQHILAI